MKENRKIHRKNPKSHTAIMSKIGMIILILKPTNYYINIFSLYIYYVLEYFSLILYYIYFFSKLIY